MTGGLTYLGLGLGSSVYVEGWLYKLVLTGMSSMLPKIFSIALVLLGNINLFIFYNIHTSFNGYICATNFLFFYLFLS